MPDILDAQRMAVAALTVDMQKLLIPRLNDSVRAALRVLVTALDMPALECRKYVNVLAALLRVTLLGIDTRKPLSNAQILQVARCSKRSTCCSRWYSDNVLRACMKMLPESS
ncbi:MAG TPA: hypothetical protein DEX36_03005 [Glutamicibacter sp.]|nr:hypothetical protein [Glutamicibacter sp.]